MLTAIFLLISWSALINAQTTPSAAHRHHYRTVCYLASWARYRVDPVTFHPEDLDTSLCTHVIFAFAYLDKTGVHIVPHEESDTTMYTRLTLLKRERPNMKVMLAVGGWNMGSEEFSALVSNHDNMVEFADNAIQFLRKYNFDGLDLDWEYPGDRGSPAQDKHHFSQLLRTLYQAFAKDHRTTNQTRLLLSAAISPTPDRIAQSYELPNISHWVDFFNVMTYDFHGAWNSETGHHSSLYAPAGNPEYDTVDYNIRFILNTTVPPAKLNMGIPFYGQTFNLTDPTNTDLGAPVEGSGGAGPLVGDPNVLTYYEVCKILTENADSVTSARLNGTNAPYLVDGRRWTGYDDAQSIQEKVAYVMDHGLGGVMIWSIDMDDFHGICGEGHYPLMHTIRNAYHVGLIG